MAVLHGAREVGVARPRPRHSLGGRTGRGLAHGHGVLPVLPVPVLDGERDGAAERHAPADAGRDVCLVALDFHPPAAAVAALAAREVLVEVVLGQREARGHAVNDGGQGLPVTFTGGEESKCHIADGTTWARWESRTCPRRPGRSRATASRRPRARDRARYSPSA